MFLTSDVYQIYFNNYVMSTSSSTPNVLVQRDNDEFSMACERIVLSTLEMLKKGDEISVNGCGEQRNGNIIARPGSQDTLEVSMLQELFTRQQKTDPSDHMFDSYGEESPSTSDCVSQDDTTEDEVEEDSHKDNKKRAKLERSKRQINITSSNKRKKATPLLRATPVIPKTMLPCKKTQVSNLQNNKSKPNKTLRDLLEDILKDLQTILKICESHTAGLKVIAPTKYRAENQSVEEDVPENEEANSEHEESSSSDDNVLINYKRKFVKGFSASYPSGPSVSISSGPSVSNPTGSSASKKHKAENTTQTPENQSVQEDVTENEKANGGHEESSSSDFNVLISHQYKFVKGFSASYPSGPSVSNPSEYSVSNPSVSSVSNPSKSSVSNPSRSSVCIPSEPTTSKKQKAETKDRTRYNQTVKEDVSQEEEDVALILRDPRASDAIIKLLQYNLEHSVSNPSRSSVSNPLRSSVSNPAGRSTSKKQAQNTDRTRYNQSVEENVSKNEGDVALNSRETKARRAMMKMINDNIGHSVSNLSRPSVSNLSRPSVSTPSRPSTLKKYKAENTNQTRCNQSAEEDISEDEDATSEHEEFNRSDDNVLISNKHRNVTVKTVHKDDEWVPIGSGKTQIQLDKYMKVNWKSYTIATRTLLLAVFPRRVLATHSLTGKKSPAFQDKPAKMCLDPKITSDVINEIKKRFKVKESLIRSIITTKCADECKMFKTRLSRNSENMPPATNEEEEE